MKREENFPEDRRQDRRERKKKIRQNTTNESSPQWNKKKLQKFRGFSDIDEYWDDDDVILYKYRRQGEIKKKKKDT